MYVCVVGGPCGFYLSVLFHVILMCTNLDNAFFFQLFGVNPCDTFPALQKDFAQRYMTACQVSLEFLEIYIKNLAVLVR